MKNVKRKMKNWRKAGKVKNASMKCEKPMTKGQKLIAIRLYGLNAINYELPTTDQFPKAKE